MKIAVLDRPFGMMAVPPVVQPPEPSVERMFNRLLIESVDGRNHFDVTLRGSNPLHPPHAELAEKSRAMHRRHCEGKIPHGYDCSEISEKMALDDPYKRQFLVLYPTKRFGEILVPEYEPGPDRHGLVRYFYHSILCVDGYVFDPKFLPEPIAKGDYLQIITGVNRTKDFDPEHSGAFQGAQHILVNRETHYRMLSPLISGTYSKTR